MTDVDVAAQLVRRLRDWAPGPGDNAIIETAEVTISFEGEVGLALRWTQHTTDQGARKFGLNTSVKDVLHRRSVPRSADLEEAFTDLLLAVVEPHAAFAPHLPEVRSMFEGV
ncbi:MAG: hypothetical protein ACRCZD_18300 [Phycicoccus sp.]